MGAASVVAKRFERLVPLYRVGRPNARVGGWAMVQKEGS